MRLSSLMKEYFDREDGPVSRVSHPFASKPGLLVEEVPLRAKDAFTWTIKKNPNRLRKKFDFQTSEGLLNFITDLLEYEAENKHNAKILIDGRSVTVEIFTHYLEDITEMDKEYASVADEIYKDSNDASDE